MSNEVVICPSRNLSTSQTMNFVTETEFPNYLILVTWLFGFQLSGEVMVIGLRISLVIRQPNESRVKFPEVSKLT